VCALHDSIKRLGSAGSVGPQLRVYARCKAHECRTARSKRLGSAGSVRRCKAYACRIKNLGSGGMDRSAGVGVYARLDQED
jgi:hypothetical protein